MRSSMINACHFETHVHRHTSVKMKEEEEKEEEVQEDQAFHCR